MLETSNPSSPTAHPPQAGQAPALNPDEIAAATTWIEPVKQELKKTLVGQDEIVERLFIGLLSNGHLLLEGVPGLAKTLAISSLAGSLQCDFQRLQFTPDLLPADILGTLIYSQQEGRFEEKLGPIFANLVLADEINRAPAKVQSALLEAMQERQVTIGDTTHPLPDPFLVMATQNPIDQEGTYRLPEAQMDRFLLKISVDYPTPSEESEILRRMASTSSKPKVSPVATVDDIKTARNAVDRVYIDPSIVEYIVRIIQATRNSNDIEELQDLVRSGSSPRGTIALALASKAKAFLGGRGYVTPDDVKNLANDVLRHRILLSYEAEAEAVSSEDIIEKILDVVPLP